MMTKTLLLAQGYSHNEIGCGPAGYAPNETLHRKHDYPMLQVDCLISKVFEVFSNCEKNPFEGFEVCFLEEIKSPSLVLTKRQMGLDWFKKKDKDSTITYVKCICPRNFLNIPDIFNFILIEQ